MLENISMNCHSSIKIKKDKTIYIDPYRIADNCNDADFVFITHSHYDHFSIEDITKIKKKDTIFITVAETETELKQIGIPVEQIIIVEPNKEYKIKGLEFKTVPAYNTNKIFHPKENNWVGYIIEIDLVEYYIAGDTDVIKEQENIRCDVAFLPIGGTYTMDAKEAAILANNIDARIVVPIHYGEIVGTKKDLEEFIKDTKKKVVVLIDKL